MNAHPQTTPTQLLALERGVLRVGDVRVEPRAMTVLADGRTTRLEPKAMRVLLCLAANTGKVVTRDEIMATVWSDVAVTEDVLNRATSMLRRALGDDARAPRFIETVPKVGYRLLAPVAVERPTATEALVGTHQTEHPQARTPQIEAENAPETDSPAARYRVPFVIAILLMAVALVGRWSMVQRRDAHTPPAAEDQELESGGANVRVVPLVSAPGRQADPALSPDGTRIAYASETGEGLWDVFVRLVDGGRTLRLTSGDAIARGPTWSPDGNELAWIERPAGSVQDDRPCRIVRAPSLGGPARTIGTCPRRIDSQMAWTPDGKGLLLSAASGPSAPFQLWNLDLATGTRRPLTAPSTDMVGDTTVAVDPTGSHIAFVRWETMGSSDVFLTSADGGEPKKITHDGRAITGLAFAAEGQDIVFISNRGGRFGIWMAPLETGTPSWLGYAQTELNTVTVARDGRMAVAEDWIRTAVARVRLGDTDVTTAIAPSNEHDWSVSANADGRETIWVSDRTGAPEIWMHTADLEDTAEAESITNLGGPFIDVPRISPDGRHIAFEIHQPSSTSIALLSRDEDRWHQWSPPDAHEAAPNWTPDGRSLLFASKRTGRWQVWRRPIEGGAAEQLTQQGGFAGFVSTDGTSLYFTRRTESGLFRRAIGGGPVIRLIDDLEPYDWRNVAMTPTSIWYFARPSGSQRVTIRRWDFDAQRSETLASLDRIQLRSGLAVSPDERWASITHVTHEVADLVLLENVLPEPVLLETGSLGTGSLGTGSLGTGSLGTGSLGTVP